MTIREFLSHLEHVKPVRGGWLARCPFHDDKNPSLSVSVKEGRILLHCHAGCITESIVEALGLKMADLFSDSGAGTHDKRIVATHPYTDEAGKVLFEVVRFEPKDFRQRRPDGKGGWVWSLNGVRRVLYGLPEVIGAKSVVVCEGEKDVESARKLGFAATCNPHGAGKWRLEYAGALRGKRVAIIADADEPGLAHGREIARSLIGIAETVRLIEALPQAKDLSEWVEKDGTREKLIGIIKETPELTPKDAERLGAQGNPLSSAGFSLVSIGEMLSKPDVPVEYVLEGVLVAGTVSLVVAKPKVGKSTFARNLCLAVSRGDSFLGLQAKQGPCIYLALEEREEDLKGDFCAMGARADDPILVHAATAPAEGVLALCRLIRERRPAVVVGDPLFRLMKIRDEKAYAETYAALGPLIDVARETGTHILLCHHSGKGLAKADAIDSPLGSTALGGAASTLISLGRTEAYRTIQTVQRIGVAMPETILAFNPATKTLSLGGSKSEADAERISQGILEYLEASGDKPRSWEAINEEVEGKTTVKKQAVKLLFNGGKVEREGTGKRGDPYLYKKRWFPSSPYTPGTRELETEKGGQDRINRGPILVPSDSLNPVSPNEHGNQLLEGQGIPREGVENRGLEGEI